MLDRDGDALAHASLGRQIEALTAIVASNRLADLLLDRLPAMGLPSWYLGAGGVTQTVWNHLHGFDPTHGIVDYDIVYFDAHDQTDAGEQAVEAEVTALVADVGARIDVTNEARVHTWYESRFGRPLAPYRSVEHAIATWPTTATSVGLRFEAGHPVLCAPFGLTDLFSMVVRPNTTLITQAVYEAKVNRWRTLWPRLTILPWPYR